MNRIGNVTSVFSPGQFEVRNRAHTVKTLLPLGIAIAIATALPGQTKYHIIQMRPEDGRFTDFKVVSVRNPQTQQEIREIVPDDVVARIEKRAKKRFGKQKSDDDSEKFQYVIARFPTWEIIER